MCVSFLDYLPANLFQTTMADNSYPLMSPSLENQSVFSDSLENIVSDFEETLTKHKKQTYTDPVQTGYNTIGGLDYNNKRPQTAMADVITNSAGGGGRLTRFSSLSGVGGRLEDFDGYTSDFSSGYAVPHVRRRPNGFSLGGEDQLDIDPQRPNYLRLSTRPLLPPKPAVTYDVPNGRVAGLSKLNTSGISPVRDANLSAVSPWSSHYGPASELSGAMSDSVSSLSSISSFQQSPHQQQTANGGRLSDMYDSITRRDAYESDSGLLSAPPRQSGGRLNGSYRGSISGRVAANIDTLANRIASNPEPSTYEIRRQSIEQRNGGLTQVAQAVSSSNRNVLQTIRDQMADSLQEMKLLASNGQKPSGSSLGNIAPSPMKTPVNTPTKDLLCGRLSATPSRSVHEDLLNRSCESPAPPVPLRSHSVSRMSEVESPLTVASPIVGKLSPATNLGRLALGGSQSTSPAPLNAGLFQSLRRENSFTHQSSGYSSNTGRDDNSYCSDSELALGDRPLERFASLRRSRRLLQSISNASVIPEWAIKTTTVTSTPSAPVRSLATEYSVYDTPAKSTIDDQSQKSPEVPPKPSRGVVTANDLTPEGEREIMRIADTIKTSGPPVVSSAYRKQFTEWKKHLEEQQAKLPEPEKFTKTTCVTSVSVKLTEIPPSTDDVNAKVLLISN